MMALLERFRKRGVGTNQNSTSMNLKRKVYNIRYMYLKRVCVHEGYLTYTCFVSVQDKSAYTGQSCSEYSCLWD